MVFFPVSIPDQVEDKLFGAMRWPTKNRPEKNSRPGSRVPGLLAIYLTWLQAGRLK
jgi:hypothetical protein